MKLYLMYIKLKELEPYLYAYTNNKDYYKRFKNERNEKLFTIKEKEVSKESYYDFAKKHKNLNLKECLFETYKDIDDEYTRDVISLVCTYNEESSVILNFEYISGEISKSTSEVALSFNSGIVDALNTLYYFDFLKQKINRRVNEYNDTWFGSSYLDGINEMDESPIGYNYDYLAIFIKMYGYTLKNSVWVN